MTSLDDRDTQKKQRDSLSLAKHHRDESSTFENDRGHLQRVTTAQSFAFNQDKYLQADHHQTSTSDVVNQTRHQQHPHRQLTQSNSTLSQGKEQLVVLNQSSQNASSSMMPPLSAPGSKAQLPPFSHQNRIIN